MTETVKDNSLDDVISAQKQLDEELQQLKNRYSRYSQLVSFQQEEEDFVSKNKEKVNPKRISLSLKRKKDVTYGLMQHDDFLESMEKEKAVEDKTSFEAMSKTANSFINSIKAKAQIKPKEFELPPTPPKEEVKMEVKKEVKTEATVETEVYEEPTEEGEHQDKEMNRLCDLVQSLLSEAQVAIDTKPDLSHPDIGKEEDEEMNPEIAIPKRIQSLNASNRNSMLNMDSLDETSSVSNKHLSIMTDTTAIVQPLAPINTNTRCCDGFDDFDDFGMSKYESLKSPYNAMTSTPNDEYIKGSNTSMNEGMNYYPPKYYPPPPEFYYGAPPAGYPPYFDPAYGPIPPYLWEEMMQKQRMAMNGESEVTDEAEAAIAMRRKEDQEIIKKTTTTTTTTTTEVKKDKKSVEGKALVKKRRRHKHRRHIRPVDADGNLCENNEECQSLVPKKTSSKLFKAQFGSDTQLFLSFFASFFVTSILVTISCLWSVIQVMAGNVNDKNLSRLLMSSSENAIRSNKKKIEQILDKDSSSSTITDESTESDSESESDSEDEEEETSGKYITAPNVSDDEDLSASNRFNQTALLSTSLKDTTTSNVNTHRRRNSL